MIKILSLFRLCPCSNLRPFVCGNGFNRRAVFTEEDTQGNESCSGELEIVI